jgi:monoamine oxidase
LVDQVGPENIKLNTLVTSIRDIEDHIEITDDKENIFRARHVIITIPPYLIIKQGIKFNPILPNQLISVMERTHTWMSDSIKFAVVYHHPFWREKGYSGTVFSQTGIATELYDHNNHEESRYALKGFLVNNAAKISREQRESMVIAQLVKLLGEDAANYLSYNEKLWFNDPNTHADSTNHIMPHQNNGHPIYERALLNGKLYLSGSETSPHFGGYMDGAVFSGKNAAAKILDKLNEALPSCINL